MSQEEYGAGPGLGGAPRTAWPKIRQSDTTKAPIERLRPGSAEHLRIRDYLLARLEESERAMSRFYARWESQEKRIQAYIDLPDYEKLLKQMANEGKPPQPTQIVVPYSFATIWTIVTYLVHTFAGRKPMFQIGSYKQETVEAAQLMELVLQYNADNTRLIKHLFQFLQDGEIYGLGVLRTGWREEHALRTVWREEGGLLGSLLGSSRSKTRERRLVYEGNEVESIDPFMFFPDPNVPMADVNRKGEFVFWRSYTGKHTLKAMEAEGALRWVDAAGPLPKNHSTERFSSRSLAAGGLSTPGWEQRDPKRPDNYYQVDQGTVEIIPAELGLGESERPQKWQFTLLNKSQVVQAEPYDADHGKHPVCVIEPYTMGYGFGHLGMSDLTAPLQDTVSWFVNSNIQNVRTSINNMWVVDPAMVEMQDIKEPGPGKIIRLKPTAAGQDIRQALQQLQVTDVTRDHVEKVEMLLRMGDALSSVNDNLRGLQNQGGRKTATEVRTTGEAAASRLAAHARLISAQGIVDLTEQMTLNLQQYLSDEFLVQIVGEKGHTTPIRVHPEQLVGDFYFPPHDGTLPLDRVALMDIWKEIFMVVAQDPELRQNFNLVEVFTHIAELGGAKNIERFKVMPDEALAAQAQQGNVVPMGGGGAPPQPMAAGAPPGGLLG